MRLELLALVHFTREYCHYLLGRKFTVRTDHSSLAWLMRFCYLQGMLVCWLEELSQYDMVIQHRPQVKNGNADGLSCHPDPLLYCDCYEVGETLESLPCGGCDFCSHLYNQWACFEVDVDDVVPLAVQKVSLGMKLTGMRLSPASIQINLRMPSGFLIIHLKKFRRSN